jgi:hypothetical protein
VGALDEEPAAAGVEGPPSAAQVLTADAGRAGDGAEQSATPILADELAVAAPEPTPATPAGVAASRPLYRWLSWLVPTLAWTGISAYYYGNFLAHPTAGVPGGPDGVIYVWFFKSVEQALAHLSNPLVSHAMNAPTGVSLMWNTAVLPLAVLLAPLTAAIGPVATVGFAMVASPVLSALAAYFAFRRITHRIAASAIAATFYGFGPFFVGQNGHLHLIAAAPFLPLILLVGYRLFVTQTGSAARAGIWLGLLAAGLFLVSEELVTFAALAAGVGVVFLALLYHREVSSKFRFAATGVAVGAGVAVAVVAYPMYFQLFGPMSLDGNLIAHRASLDLASFVRPPAFLHFTTSADIAATRSFFTNSGENSGYIGIPLLIVIAGLLIWLGVQRRSLVPVWWLLTTGAVVSFSLGPTVWINGHLTGVHAPWWLLDHGPLRSAIVARFSLLTALMVAFLIAWGLAKISGRAYVAVGAAVCVALVSLLPSGQYVGLSGIQTPAFFTTAAVNRIPAGATVLILPNRAGPGPGAHIMYWQMKAGMRFNIVGGYGVFSDNGNWSYFGALPDFARVLDSAGRTGVRPTEPELLAARPSLLASPVSYIVITQSVRHPMTVKTAAEELTGCTTEAVADVSICAIPR